MDAFDKWFLRFMYTALYIAAEISANTENVALAGLRDVGVTPAPGERASELLDHLNSLSMPALRAELMRRGMKCPA